MKPAPIAAAEHEKELRVKHSPEFFEEHVETCPLCRNGYLCDEGHDLLKDLL